MQSVFLLAILLQLYLLNVAHGLSLSDFYNEGDSPQVPPVLRMQILKLYTICTIHDQRHISLTLDLFILQLILICRM